MESFPNAKRAAIYFSASSSFLYLLHWMTFRNYDGDLFTDILFPLLRSGSIPVGRIHLFSPLTPLICKFCFGFGVSPLLVLHLIGIFSIFSLGYFTFHLSRYSFSKPLPALILIALVLWNNGLFLVFRGIDDNTPQASLFIMLIYYLIRMSRKMHSAHCIALAIIGSVMILIHVQALPFLIIISMVGFFSSIKRFEKKRFKILFFVGVVPLAIFVSLAVFLFFQRSNSEIPESAYATSNNWSYFSKFRPMIETVNWLLESGQKIAKFSSFHSDKGFSYLFFAFLIFLVGFGIRAKKSIKKGLQYIYIYIYIVNVLFYFAYKDGSPERWVIGIPILYLSAMAGFVGIFKNIIEKWSKILPTNVLAAILVILFTLFPAFGCVVSEVSRHGRMLPFPNDFVMSRIVCNSEDSEILIVPEIEAEYMGLLRKKKILFMSPDKMSWNLQTEDGSWANFPISDFKKIMKAFQNVDSVSILDSPEQSCKDIICYYGVGKCSLFSNQNSLSSASVTIFGEWKIMRIKCGITSGSSGN